MGEVYVFLAGPTIVIIFIKTGQQKIYIIYIRYVPYIYVVDNNTPFVCICKHTATRIWRGCPANVGYLPVSVSWPSALHCNPCPPHCSPGNVPTSTPGQPSLRASALCQDWSANVKYGIRYCNVLLFLYTTY